MGDGEFEGLKVMNMCATIILEASPDIYLHDDNHAVCVLRTHTPIKVHCNVLHVHNIHTLTN